MFEIQAFRSHLRGLSECGAAAKTGAGIGAGGLKSKTVLRIRWSSSSEYLITEELAEPKAVSGATTGIAAGVGARVAAGAGVRWLLSLVGVLPASLSLLRGYNYSCWFQAYHSLTPGRRRLMPNAQRPTPNARAPTLLIRRPAPNTWRPGTNARRPTPDARLLTPDDCKFS